MDCPNCGKEMKVLVLAKRLDLRCNHCHIVLTAEAVNEKTRVPMPVVRPADVARG